MVNGISICHRKNRISLRITNFISIFPIYYRRSFNGNFCLVLETTSPQQYETMVAYVCHWILSNCRSNGLYFCKFGNDYSRRIFRSEEHMSELQSRFDLVCRLLLEKKKIK